MKSALLGKEMMKERLPGHLLTAHSENQKSEMRFSVATDVIGAKMWFRKPKHGHNKNLFPVSYLLHQYDMDNFDLVVGDSKMVAIIVHFNLE